jgi:hypothetical protein
MEAITTLILLDRSIFTKTTEPFDSNALGESH